MPGKTLQVGHNDDGDIVINFDPDDPDSAYHAIFTLEEAEDFARTILRRVRAVRDDTRLTDHREQSRLARGLLGRYVRFNSESEVAPSKRVVAVTRDGMVAIEGYVGLFAPHLFRVIKENQTDTSEEVAP